MSYDFRNIGFIVLLALMVSFWGCGNSKNKDEKPETEKSTKHDPKKVNSKPEYKGEVINIDSVEISQRIYVSDTGGVFLYSKPDSSINYRIEKVPYRKALDVLDEGEKWYTIVYHTGDETNGKHYKDSLEWWHFSTKLYVRKSDAVPINQLAISEKDMYACYRMPDEFSYDKSELDYLLRKHLQFEFIDADKYNFAIENTLNLLDTNQIIQKHRNKLFVPCDTGALVLIDIPSQGESRKIFHFLGFYSSINKYLIYIEYFEAGQAYILIDKHTGDITKFHGQPFLMQESKFILAVYFHPYGDYPGNIEFSSISNDRIEPIFKVNTINWAPLALENPVISSDGSMYMKIQFTPNMWTSNGSINEFGIPFKISIRK